MHSIFNAITTDFPEITFVESKRFVWHPQTQQVHYEPSALNEIEGIWSLLHEVGHAKLEHTQYFDDLQLLMMEVAAWAEAKQLAANYRIKIDQDHIDSCIDSYRDWLHTRSACVECGTNSLQANLTTYHCHNCGTQWNVPASRLCMTRKRRIAA